jgi:photosystem I P700 chlorophyll a apoprotein A2
VSFVRFSYANSIEPVFAQWIQASQGKTAYGFDLLLSQPSSAAYSASQSLWLPGWLEVIVILIHYS